jgi:hypothetical protein
LKKKSKTKISHWFLNTYTCIDTYIEFLFIYSFFVYFYIFYFRQPIPIDFRQKNYSEALARARDSTYMFLSGGNSL